MAEPDTATSVHALTIAGSDPSGGAGIQRDLRTFAECGAWGMAAITALTAQSPRRVAGVHAVPAEFVDRQLTTLAEDCRLDTVKIGMLSGTAVIEVVTDWLSRQPFVDLPVVLDPVMVATSGGRLLDDDATVALRGLIARASVITPNLPEAAVLTGREPADSLAEMYAQAEALLELGAPVVLLKGGHLTSQPEALDLLADETGVRELRAPWVAAASTHGTGCTLSSALAALRPHHPDWYAAATAAKAYLSGTLERDRH